MCSNGAEIAHHPPTLIDHGCDIGGPRMGQWGPGHVVSLPAVAATPRYVTYPNPLMRPGPLLSGIHTYVTYPHHLLGDRASLVNYLHRRGVCTCVGGGRGCNSPPLPLSFPKTKGSSWFFKKPRWIHKDFTWMFHKK